MAEYLSPGVYVEEYDNSPRSIEGVGTSTAGFVGMAVKGPTVGAPTLVTNFAEYLRQFGGYLNEYTHGDYRHLPSSVEQFFANGGTRCFVARVVPEDAKCATAKVGALSFTAANEGAWGNRIVITVAKAANRKMQLVEKVDAKVYTAKSTAGFKEGDVVTFGEEVNRIATIFENTITFEEDFKGDVVDKDLVPKSVLLSSEIDLQIKYAAEVETYAGLNFNPLSPNYVARKLSGSELVKVEVEAGEGIKTPVAEILGDDKATGAITFAGGSDGTIEKVNAGTFIGVNEGPGKRTGIQSFVENDLVSMMAVPGVTIPEVIVALVAHCETTGSRVAVLDMPENMKKTKDLIEYRSMIDSTYAAMYHPWIKIFDPSTKKPGFIPPSGVVMGVYSRTDIARGVHKAPANETIACTGLSINYTKEEQDILNPEGINLIRALPGQGIRIWGARTASSNSAFKYINIRRLFIFVEESIKRNTNWVVFEPNTSNLWFRVRLTIEGFLDGLWRTGMLAGDSPSEAFFVDIGTSTMSREDIMNGRLICNIGIAPSRPAEFVIFRVTQHTAEAGGGEE